MTGFAPDYLAEQALLEVSRLQRQALVATTGGKAPTTWRTN